MASTRAHSVPHVIIEPHRGWRGVDWRELFEYRDLLAFMIWRNIRVRYAQSSIGVGWAILQPVATMIVFTVIFGRLVGVKSEGAPYAVFTFCALVPWTYFANCLTDSAASMVSNAHIIRKIYFPRLILPIAIVGARTVDFAIAMVILGLLMLAYGIAPNAGVVVLPLLIIITLFTAGGLGLWLTALAVQYRDVSYAMQFAVQMLMYAAPVVYPASLIPAEYRYLYALNPMVGVIEGFRAALLGTRPMPWDYIAIGFVVASLLAFAGTAFFRRKEHVFADVA